MNRILDRCLDAVPVLGDWRKLHRAVGPFRPGHFYSPIPSGAEVEQAIGAAANGGPGADGIDLRADAQRELLRSLGAFYRDQPFAETPQPDCRYHLDNGMFAYADALMLHAMMRHLRPRQVIEVGSGFSSAVMLETNERHLGNSAKLTFIEPYPDRLHGLLRAGDERRVELLRQPVQATPLDRFAQLQAGDILFIDSSHVGKCHSDVLFLLFSVLPRLRPGVFVHIHDIFPYFEYPAAWLREGRFWNEAYLVRAFLQWNQRFRIALWVPWIMGQEAAWVGEHMPLCQRNVGGSMWLSVHGD